jgi:hypothetical protein
VALADLRGAKHPGILRKACFPSRVAQHPEQAVFADNRTDYGHHLAADCAMAPARSFLSCAVFSSSVVPKV